MDNRQKKLMFLGILLLGCLGTGLWQQSFKQKLSPLAQPMVQQPAQPKIKQAQAKTIKVYISGAVHQPGIYDLPVGARAAEALAAAGGVLAEAQTEKVNVARKLRDGSHVYVPFVKSQNYSAKGKANLAANKQWQNKSAVAAKTAKLDLNRATAAELVTLPGIGPAMANRILALRRTRRFYKVEDLLQVRGIGQAKLEKLRPYVKVE